MTESKMFGNVSVEVLEARKLVRKEDAVVVVVTVDKQTVRTKEITLTADEGANFGEEFKFDINGSPKGEIHIAVWTGSGKEFLGQAIIPLSALRHGKAVDMWYKLEKRKWRLSDKVGGDVHLKLQFNATDKKVGIDDFETLKVLGKGGFGKVMQVAKKDTNRIYAMKVIRKEHVVERNEIDHTLAEKNVLATINHPYIINLKFAFQTEDKLYLVLDFINGGELFYHLQREKRFSEKRAKFYAAEIVLALEYLHELGIIYRDLKPENLLLDGMGHICMTDFGLCKTGLGVGDKTTTFCGSLEYLAPEILSNNTSGYDKAVDWWSLGILLYEMMAGLPPFYSQDQNVMARQILEQKLTFPAEFGDPVKDLLTKLLQRDPSKRLANGKEIKAHAFFADVDWDALSQRKVDTPFKPLVSSPTDTSNFDAEFTSEPAVDSYVDSRLSKSVQENFAGFTYVNDSEVSAAAAADK